MDYLDENIKLYERVESPDKEIVLRDLRA